MFKLLVLFFVLLYEGNDIFKYVKKKHGQHNITVIRSIEKTQRKFIEVKTCNKERLTPTFTKVKKCQFAE